jgi:hypothetical protein
VSKALFALLLGVLPAFAAAQVPAGAIEATTATGEKVYLLTGGRWEYADPQKAAPQRQERRAEEARERNAQGILSGRRIYEGDKDYNRGSLNPNRR